MLDAVIGSFTQAETWMSLATLTLLEIVLGIDNIIFLSIISSRLEKSKQKLARQIGLSLALIGRIAFLCSITAVMKFKEPVFSISNFEVSWRDLIFLVGGAFLIYKSIAEIRAGINGQDEDEQNVKKISFTNAIAQIALLDVVFALDSMITAVGLSNMLWVMIAANVVAMIIMLYASEQVSAFIDKYPRLKMLALAFLLMVGVTLVADGMHYEIPKEYIYFSIGFSLVAEIFNILAEHRAERRAEARKAGAHTDAHD